MKSLCYILVVLGLGFFSFSVAQDEPASGSPAHPAQPSVDYRAIQTELLLINEEDQKGRMQWPEVEKQYGADSQQMKELWKLIRETDAANLARVRRILDQYGWLGPANIGPTANTTLFLVIQHSDLVTQQKYLPMMRDAVKDGRATGSALALLEDRVALREGRPQIYGSQIIREGTEPYYVQAMIDPDKVDERRASVGLGPIADYVKRWDVVWNVETYQAQLPELMAKLRQRRRPLPPKPIP